MVWNFGDDQIEKLGSEDVSTVRERAELSRKLEVLEKGLIDLDAFTAKSGTKAATFVNLEHIEH